MTANLSAKAKGFDVQNNDSKLRVFLLRININKHI
jgi:hypothetical protein